ncbi:hypothetical protein Lmor_0340, partial [Legionella moravica]
MLKRNRIFYIYQVLVGLFLWFTAMSMVQAARPLWTFTPAVGSNPTQAIPANGSASIQYIIENQSNKSKQLVMVPIPGVTQTAPCPLAPKGQAGSSCTLNLVISGSALPQNGVHGGPALCQTNADGSPNSSQCYQPSPGNQLNITLSTAPPTPPTPSATISVNGSPLLLIPNTTGSLIVTNTGSNTALNVMASLPPALMTDVTQDASNCAILIAGESCNLHFTVNAQSHPPTAITVAGTNTNTVGATITLTLPYVTNGTVNAIVLDAANNLIYLGGSFSLVGPNVGNGVPLDNSTGLPVATFPLVNAVVHAVVADGDGGWYIGGSFTNVGGEPRNRIAHILSDGSVDLTWNPDVNGTVLALAVSSTTVYAGGVFTSAGGQARNNIAALDITTGNATAWNPNASSSVTALAVSGSTVYASGTFTSIGGQARNRIAALDASTGNATAW